MDYKKIIGYRREFHHYPEIAWHEIRTTARVAQILTDMGYEVLVGRDVICLDNYELALLSKEERDAEMERAIAQGADKKWVERTEGFPGAMVIIDTKKPGPVTAFRFDIDCLPYQEPSKEGFRPFDEGYISCNANRVHACGHDAHTAIGLGIAGELLDRVKEYNGKIKLIFQPAEERNYGAQSIIDKGHLDDVDHFIAMHVALGADGAQLQSGMMACGCKDFLSDHELEIDFHGRAAHPGGDAHEGKNALLAACTAALNLHAIANHGEGFTRVNVGRLEAGVAVNTIPPNAHMHIEYRGQTRNIAAYLERRVFEVLDGAAKSYGIEYSCIDYGETPAGKSDDEMMKIIQRAAKKVPWFKQVYFEGSVGGTDDAVAMINKVQDNGGIGTYIGIGTTTTQPVHNEEFDLDEDCIPAAVALCIHALDEIHG